MPLLNKDEVEKALIFRNKEDMFLFEDWENKPEQRTKAQNSSFQRCFTEISKKLGYKKARLKDNVMKALFWIERTKLWGIEYENAVISSTTELDKEQASLLIDTLVAFGEKAWCWILITPLERQSLFYNN